MWYQFYTSNPRVIGSQFVEVWLYWLQYAEDFKNMYQARGRSPNVLKISCLDKKVKIESTFAKAMELLQRT